MEHYRENPWKGSWEVFLCRSSTWKTSAKVLWGALVAIPETTLRNPRTELWKQIRENPRKTMNGNLGETTVEMHKKNVANLQEIWIRISEGIMVKSREKLREQLLEKITRRTFGTSQTCGSCGSNLRWKYERNSGRILASNSKRYLKNFFGRNQTKNLCWCLAKVPEATIGKLIRKPH